MLCSVVKHLGSGRALKKWGKTLDCVSCFPVHFFRALPLRGCFTTEQSTVEASLFVNYQTCLIFSSPSKISFCRWSTSKLYSCLSSLSISGACWLSFIICSTVWRNSCISWRNFRFISANFFASSRWVWKRIEHSNDSVWKTLRKFYSFPNSPYLTNSLLKPSSILWRGRGRGGVNTVLYHLLLFLARFSIRLLNWRERSGHVVSSLNRQTVLIFSYGGQ